MLHALRIVASFALLGAVLAGIGFGWTQWSIDPRIIGVIVGTLVGIAVVIRAHQTDHVYASL
jgi:hypothetical protein